MGEGTCTLALSTNSANLDSQGRVASMLTQAGLFADISGLDSIRADGTSPSCIATDWEVADTEVPAQSFVSHRLRSRVLPSVTAPVSNMCIPTASRIRSRRARRRPAPGGSLSRCSSPAGTIHTTIPRPAAATTRATRWDRSSAPTARSASPLSRPKSHRGLAAGPHEVDASSQLGARQLHLPSTRSKA